MIFRLFAVVVLMLSLTGCAKKAAVPVSGCQDIAKTGQLNVLTLNTLFDERAAVRQQSWKDIAQFAKANNVHVLLIQEAVLTDVGRLQQVFGTSDSARDLQRALNEQSAEPYDLRVAWESGVPLVLSTANAVLSRCTITRHFPTFLPLESETVFEGINLKVTRNLEAAHLDLPGFGALHVYNAHFCSGCSAQDLRQQVGAALSLVQAAETKVAGRHVVLGGDFNLDLSKGAAEQAIYRSLTQAGFRDVYADYRKSRFGEALEVLCANRTDVHCTDGVSPIQGLVDQQTGAPPSPPARLDYLFLLGTDTVQLSKVVFNPGNRATGPINPDEPAVSDHSGVFAQIVLTH